MNVVQNLILSIIKGYQVFISPLTPPHCKYLPTCSEYTRQCIASFPLHKALLLTVRRILRCHPWAQGGYDPVPHCDSLCNHQFHNNSDS